MGSGWDDDDEKLLSSGWSEDEKFEMRRQLNHQALAAGVKACFVGAIVIGVICAIVAIPLLRSKETGTVSFTINKAERVSNRGRAGSQYIVYTDEETFKITDSYVHGRFDSSDLYGQMEKGDRWKCDVTGYRIEFLSEYRNLVKCEKASS